MAYNAAANIRPVRPGAAFLDARDAVQKNALMERQQVGNEQQQAAVQANMLAQQQAQQEQAARAAQDQQFQAEDRAKAAEKDDATLLFNSFSHLSRLKASPEQFAATAARMIQNPAFQRHNITLEDLTPDQIDEALPAFAAQSGQAPVDQFEQVNGPRGSVYNRNARTGEGKLIVGADNTESPNYGGRPKAPSGYMYGPDGSSLMAIPGGPADPNTPSTKDNSRNFAMADKLRDEFNAQSKDFINVGDSYNIVQETAKNPTAAGDLSLIFAYMKMLDPNSVVREQEFANAQNAAGVPDQIRNQYNKVISGERLNETQRKDFIGQARNLFNTRKARQDTITKRYTEIAKRNKLNPDDVVGDMSVVMGDAPPGASPAPGGARVPNGVAIHNTSKSGRKIVSRDGGTTWEYE